MGAVWAELLVASMRLRWGTLCQLVPDRPHRKDVLVTSMNLNCCVVSSVRRINRRINQGWVVAPRFPTAKSTRGALGSNESDMRVRSIPRRFTSFVHRQFLLSNLTGVSDLGAQCCWRSRKSAKVQKKRRDAAHVTSPLDVTNYSSAHRFGLRRLILVRVCYPQKPYHLLSLLYFLSGIL